MLLAATLFVLGVNAVALLEAHRRRWDFERSLATLLGATGAALACAISIFSWWNHVLDEAFRERTYELALARTLPWRRFSAWVIRECIVLATGASVLAVRRGIGWAIPILVLLVLLWGIVIMLVALGVAYGWPLTLIF
jgi:hypothetical protein